MIEETGKLDAPGKPGTYGVTPEFFRMFGFNSLEELPELPRYKVDENQQIVIDDVIEEQDKVKNDNENNEEEAQNEAPMPAREENDEKSEREN